jgi:pyruvate dehydrogenase E2 component (dihydrolipoamide acetyltransferase)
MAEMVIMPKLGFDMAEGTLVRWLVGEGERVEKGNVLAEIETDKATVEVESAYSGVVKRHLIAEGTVVPVNTPIAVIGEADEEIDLEALLGQEALPQGATPQVAVEEAAEERRAGEEVEGARLPGGVRASPLARRIAVELGVDLTKVKGSGPGGRIVKADIETYMKAPAGIAAAPVIAPPPAMEEREERAEVYVPLSRLRQIIGRRMSESTRQVPHFFVTHEYEMTALMDLRSQVNALLPEEEKVSVNDFIIKAVALTLREFPNLNASLDEANDRIVQHGQINIGVAVALEEGLLTVVCRQADCKSIRQISAEVRGMVQRAREGKVRPEDIEGSTFTVSNLGMYDVEHFIAIINPPEAAILALGSVRQVAAVVEGEIRPTLRMKATISVDHRVSDGAEAARFLQRLSNYLEQPLRLMI